MRGPAIEEDALFALGRAVQFQPFAQPEYLEQQRVIHPAVPRHLAIQDGRRAAGRRIAVKAQVDRLLREVAIATAGT